MVRKAPRKQRTAWIMAMAACALFLVMAVRLYDVSLGAMTQKLLVIAALFGLTLGAAALLGWILVALRRYFDEHQ